MEHFVDYILAAVAEDMDSWANILFIIVIAAFWIISAFLKVKGKKLSDSQKKGERSLSPYDKKKAKQKSLIESMLGEVLGLTEEKTVSQTTQKRAENTNRYLKDEWKKPSIRRAVSSKRRIPEEAEAEKSSKLLDSYKSTLSEIESIEPKLEKGIDTGPPSVYLERLFENGKTDLKKAIIYSEILGKPLSLRETCDSLF